ncbi:MAG: aldo/keto reductase [Coriobacteriia bacterium]|nr:aldo/keto reductase [Coriobacteriia bacterium]
MDYLKLHDGKRIHQLGFGTYKIPADVQGKNAVLCALSEGYRLIDTAEYYANESMIGEALAEAKLDRDELFITTKIWNESQRRGTQEKSFKQSLQDLQLDYVDLLLVHWPVQDKFLETFEVLLNLQEQGLSKSIGVANFRKHHLEKLKEEFGVMPVLDQIELHPRMQDVETLSYAQEHDIVMQAWAPLGRGMYSDYPEITELANKYEKTHAQIILRWGIQKGFSVIPKSMKPSRIKENFEVFDFELSASDLETITQLNQNQPLNPKTTPDTFSF